MNTDKEGVTYFVTLECFQRQPLLMRPAIKQMLLAALIETKKRFGLRLAAYVFLDDHVHILFVTPADAEYLGPMNYLRARFVRTWREQEHALDETPFWSHGVMARELRDADDLRAHLDYIHYDPVKYGICARAVDYPWSSLPARVEQGHYPENWAVLAPPASVRRLAQYGLN